MAATSFPLTAPTGANQYTDQSYALPGLGVPGSSSTPSDALSFNFATPAQTETGSSPSSGQNTGFEMFTPTSPQPTTGAPAPGIVPQQGSPINPVGPTYKPGGPAAPYNPNNPTGNVGGVLNAGTQDQTVTTLYPGFTNQFYNWLQSQMGQGAAPFNLSAIMPSTGQPTAPGTLTAPENPILQALQQFYQTGTGGPTGSSTLASMAQTGNPTDVGPAWQAMNAAENQNTQNNAADLREQFAFGGDLASSPFANAMTQFYNQNTLNQNAQLTQAEQAAQESAAGRQLSAATGLQTGAGDLATGLQSLDQSSINNMLAEFIRTSPDYNPLLSEMGGAATTFPPTISGSVGVGGMGGAVGSAGTALSGIADLWSALSNSNSGGGQAASTPIEM